MTGKPRDPLFRRFLVGYDGSKKSGKAVNVSLSLAESVGARVLRFAVTGPNHPRPSRWRPCSVAKENFAESFKKITESAKGHHIELQTATAVGHPAEQIIHRAEADATNLTQGLDDRLDGER
jgi:hypothetical protein